MKKKVLVADDDLAIRDIFQIILENAGYEVDLRPNANDLLKLNSDLPDLFIIDRLLSGVDGIDICKHLKDQPATKEIPIIIVSASPDARKLSKMAGADDFIEKPLRMAVMLNLVEELIAKKSSVLENGRRKHLPIDKS